MLVLVDSGPFADDSNGLAGCSMGGVTVSGGCCNGGCCCCCTLLLIASSVCCCCSLLLVGVGGGETGGQGVVVVVVGSRCWEEVIDGGDVDGDAVGVFEPVDVIIDEEEEVEVEEQSDPHLDPDSRL